MLKLELYTKQMHWFLDKVNIVASADPGTHTPIIYPVGIIKDSKHYEAAKEFYSYLQSDDALEGI